MGASEQAIPRITTVSSNSANKITSASSRVNFDGFNCVKRDTVRLLGNVAYQQTDIQNQVSSNNSNNSITTCIIMIIIIIIIIIIINRLESWVG